MSTNHDVRAPLSPVKRAILELRRARTQIKDLQRAKNEPIAITGVGLRFPGRANDMGSLWQLLRDRVDAVVEVPPERWDIDAFYDPDPDAPGKMSTRWGGFLDNIAEFDADFFGISRREAMTMDPQQRLLMITAWEALENAGQSPHRLVGSSTGIFLGISSSDYIHKEMQRLQHADIDGYLASGASHSVASGRLSYFFGLHGPSISLDTACSSSLVAVHLACQSLRAGECNLALAGGVNLVLAPEFVINFSKARMMAADGRCKVFDAAADGYVRGEGAGMIVLKRLSDALEDRDRILAVIRGSAVNQDGRTNGLTAPNGPSQQAVIRQALQNADIKPAEIDYVETHGTGTPLGDPIEVQALAAALGENRSMEKPLVIASIKANIGHLEAAAGIAGLIKVVAALQHEEIPPQLNIKTLNPYVPWKDLPVRVPDKGTPWLAGNGRRIAGVSSFGFSGTNAHVVIEDAPSESVQEAAQNSSTRFPYLLNLSAKTESGLKELARSYESYLEARHEIALGDICHTASTGRAHFDHRLSLVARSTEAMREKLASFLSGENVAGLFSGRFDGAPRSGIVFLFTGQGDGYVNMARALFEAEPRFRAILEDCDSQLRGYLEKPLLSVLDAAPGSLSLDEDYAHPALFAVGYAIAELWRSWGIIPTIVVGHGVGEIAAGTVAGMISLHEALRLVVSRDDEFARQILCVRFNAPAITLVSTRSLKPVTATDLADPSYWRDDANGGDQVGAAVEALIREGYRIFVDAGLDSRFSDRLEKLLMPYAGACLRSLGPRGNDWEPMLETLAALYVRGVNIDWDSFYQYDAVRKVALPTYPFSPRNYWFERGGTQGKLHESHAVPKLWDKVTAGSEHQSRQMPLDLALHTYEAKWRILDQVATEYMMRTLRALGAFTSAREPHTVDTLMQSCTIVPTYRLLIVRWLKNLVAEDRLKHVGGNYFSTDSGHELAVDALRSEAKERLADIPFILEYLERCGEMAAAVLTGKVSALETLFPGGSTDFAEQLYEQWSYSRYFNGIVRAAVDGVVRSRSGVPLRCIEVGAGTGGTTASILPALPPERALYCFTDVSEFFFSRASEKFRAYPFVRYGVLDLEKNSAGQGYRSHDFNVVVAANVLHATRDIRASVEQITSLLAPNGILILYEVTRPRAWFDISTALIEGWQVFNDGLRLDSPLLNREQWHEILRAGGFAEVQAYPEAHSAAQVLGAHVFVARMPGMQGAEQIAHEDARGLNHTLGRLSLPEKGANGKAIVESATDVLQKIKQASETERQEILIEYVRGHVSKVLGREESRPVEGRQRLMDLGIDSLMAVQLRNLLGTGLALKQPLPATLIFDYPTVEVIAAYLEKRIFGAAEDSSAAKTTAQEKAAATLARLSDDQVAEMLLRKLETS